MPANLRWRTLGFTSSFLRAGLPRVTVSRFTKAASRLFCYSGPLTFLSAKELMSLRETFSGRARGWRCYGWRRERYYAQQSHSSGGVERVQHGCNVEMLPAWEKSVCVPVVDASRREEQHQTMAFETNRTP